MTNKEIKEKLEGYFAQGMRAKAILLEWPECPLTNSKIKQRRRRWERTQATKTPENTGILEGKNLSEPKTNPKDQAHPVEVEIASEPQASGEPEDELAKYRAKRQAQAVGVPSDNETVKDLPPGSAVVIFQHLLNSPNMTTLRDFIWTDIIATTDARTRANLYSTYIRAYMAEQQTGGGGIGTGAGDSKVGATTFLDDDGEVQVMTDDERDDMIAQMIKMGIERLGAG
ncbi:hypothetical protein SPB21_19040 [Leptothoe sp. ISB3NOV94-8A]